MTNHEQECNVSVSNIKEMNKIDRIVGITQSKKFQTACGDIQEEIRKVYLESSTPWVICFSGGKDSTALLQLVFYALSEIPRERITKEIHVLSNDTLVENPSIVKHVNKQLEQIAICGKSTLYAHSPGLFNVARVSPKSNDTFWVNLIGKGYPSPNRWFRWCTDRLKIAPTSMYIENALNKNGQVIILLGTRKAESSNRAASMNTYSNNGHLRNHTLPNAFVYAPISELSNNDVWAYLLQTPNPWGSDNMNLLALYGNACSGGECPFVIETRTQSCGKSRFGCWVCTVVDRDKSMENFIRNGEQWMAPLLDFRNWIYNIRLEAYQYVPENLKSKAKFSGFLLHTRKEMLSRLLETQRKLNMRLINDSELNIIMELFKADETDYYNEPREFTYELAKNKKLAVVSDFDISKTRRTRIGPINLGQANLVKIQNVSSSHISLTRIMYYLIE